MLKVEKLQLNNMKAISFYIHQTKMAITNIGTATLHMTRKRPASFNNVVFTIFDIQTREMGCSHMSNDEAFLKRPLI